MTPITDYVKYNSGMRKSMMDKLYFLDKIFEVKNILDFGCANGEMLKQIGDEYSLYGYDIDEEMLDEARINNPDATYFSDFDLAISNLKPEDTLLTLSSVIHEVYSYSNTKEIERFWNNVYNTGFKYISVRDLMVSNSCDRDVDINDYIKLISYSDSETLQSFIDVWGDITSNKQLIHYLLKYRYKVNWNREVRENYLSISTEQLLKTIPSSKYEVVYYEHYILPFTKEAVKNDYDINLVDNTHVKLLLKRR